MRLGYRVLATGCAILASACGSNGDSSNGNSTATNGATGATGATGAQSTTGTTAGVGTDGTQTTAGDTGSSTTTTTGTTTGTTTTTTGSGDTGGTAGAASTTDTSTTTTTLEPDTAGEPGAMGEPDAVAEPGAMAEPDVVAEPGTMGEPDVVAEPDVVGEPAGAYEACSGTPVPSLTLTPVVEDLDLPIFATTPSGDASTMYVVERSGALLRVDLNGGSTTTLMEVNTSIDAECGFLSAALHPNFDAASENRIYVSYSATCPAQIFGSGGSNTLDEYTVSGDTATYSQTLFQIDEPEGNHNGGNLAFGPDGYLYYSLGDGGGGNDQHGDNGNGQDVNVPLGSILRFDVDNPSTPPAGNLSSADVGGASVDSRIFHYGLRNPWRFSFDRETGDLYIGDVGQDTTEEVSFAPAGSGPKNFGWSAREGLQACGACGHSLLAGTTATDPIHTYATAAGGGGFFQGSITGGYVYRGSAIPGLWGRYIYGDYVRGDIRALSYDGNGGVCDQVDELVPSANIPAESLSSFAQDSDGEVYVINMARGSILRIDAQ